MFFNPSVETIEDSDTDPKGDEDGIGKLQLEGSFDKIMY